MLWSVYFLWEQDNKDFWQSEWNQMQIQSSIANTMPIRAPRFQLLLCICVFAYLCICVFVENLRHGELFPPHKRSSLAVSERRRNSTFLERFHGQSIFGNLYLCLILCGCLGIWPPCDVQKGQRIQRPKKIYRHQTLNEYDFSGIVSRFHAEVLITINPEQTFVKLQTRFNFDQRTYMYLSGNSFESAYKRRSQNLTDLIDVDLESVIVIN